MEKRQSYEVDQVSISLSIKTGKITYCIPRTWTGEVFVHWKQKNKEKIREVEELLKKE